jgi:thiamine transport system permease protein
MTAALDRVPAETWRLAAQLGMGQGAVFRLIEWPALSPVLFPTAAVIFALCFTSFAVVLTLGGGPGATILEVAIYQALRFEFDLDRAVALSLVQIALAGTLAILLASLARGFAAETGLGARFERRGEGGAAGRLGEALAVVLALALVVAPLAGIVVPSLAALTVERLTDGALWRAAGWSLAIGLGAGGLALAIGLGLLLTVRELGPRRGRPGAAAAFEASGTVILVTPPVLLGAGLFLALRDRIDVLDSAAALVVAVNAVAVLPFVLRVLGPEMRRTVAVHDRLCASLGIAGIDRWRVVDWPTIRAPAGAAFGIAAALAAGELGVIALFGSPQTTTLPLLIFQRMGAYRMDEAAVGVAVLLGLSLALLVGLERLLSGGRRRA